MDNISYSVVIRTLGNAGDKYRSLLDSIQSQTVQPEEIIVAIPDGCELDHTIGTERIVRCEKGMVTQRAVGINEAKSEYILVVDDDVEFPSDFVEGLHHFMTKNNLDCVLPMDGISESNVSELNLNLPFFKRIRGAVTGQVFVSSRKSKFLDKITYTAGHRIFKKSNKLDGCYYCQCGNFQCFYLSTNAAKNVNFLDETWLETGTITRYASYDDPTFFYKLYLQGGKIAYSLRSRYLHLDATAGRQTKTKQEEKVIRYYSVAKNRTIFWYKFIWKQKTDFTHKVAAFCGGFYGTFNYTIYNLVINFMPKNWGAIKAMFVGYKEAFSYIKQLRRGV